MTTVDRRGFFAATAAIAVAARAPSWAASAAPVHSATLETATIGDLNSAMAAGTLTSEQLTRLYLARIARFDPGLRAVLALNSHALPTARALDAERRARGPRSELHGIPIVLKDNIDTADLPTTGGSFVLAGSIPRQDAFIVSRLRAAGAIILAKVNMSEFAAGEPLSSIGGQTRNPYNPDYIPGGSSGGAGVAITAAYAALGVGTDTGGSVRGPSTINGIVGLKPTKGLLSMGGIIPLALSFDTPGPMARSVRDVAIGLGVMAGVDPADPATAASREHSLTDYTRFLNANALAGARVGLVRNFTGNDAEFDRAIERAAEAIRAAGGVVVDVRLPQWLMDIKGSFYTQVRWPEFRPQIEAYLATLAPGYPRTLSELMQRSEALPVPSPAGYVPNPSRWSLFKTEAASGTTADANYRSVHDYGLPLVRHALEATLDAQRLDAFIYLTTSARPPRLHEATPAASSAEFASTSWATQFASLAGFPDLVVPCGFTGDGLPIGMSFMGRAYSEPQLLALGYAFEQLTRARKPPPRTPALAGESIRW